MNKKKKAYVKKSGKTENIILKSKPRELTIAEQLELFADIIVDIYFETEEKNNKHEKE